MPENSPRSSPLAQPESESWSERAAATGKPIVREGTAYVGGREMQRTEDRAARAWDDVVFSDGVMKLWLEGEAISSIMEKLQSTYHLVLKALTERRTELRDLQNSDLLEMAAERIEAFRDIKRRAVRGMEIRPGQTPQLLTVALRAEENIGRIQGVLNDKVIHLGRIEHVEKKLYDFEDNFPAQGNAKANQVIIEVRPPQ